MSLLNKVETGRVKKPHFLCIYGTPGVGKSSFAAEAPSPLFIDIEEGSENLDVSRVKPKSLDEVHELLNDLLVEQHDYKTIVLDSLDHLELLVHAEIEKTKKKKVSEFGYGQGYALAADMLNKVIDKLVELRRVKFLHIVLIAHSKVKTHSNPMQLDNYDRFELKLSNASSALVKERVDTILFANYEVFVKEVNGKHKALGDGRRIVHTTNKPAFEAKNRFDLPDTLPLSWSEFVVACESSSTRVLPQVMANIASMAESIKSSETRDKVQASIARAGKDLKMLLSIENRLKEMTLNSPNA